MRQGDFGKVNKVTHRRTAITEIMIKRRRPSLRALAEQFEVSKTTITRDLTAIAKEWRDSRITNMAELRDRELAKIDQLEMEAWDALEHSGGKITKERVEQELLEDAEGEDAGLGISKKIKETTYQDPSYKLMNTILQCGRDRRSLLGLDKQTVLDVFEKKRVVLVIGDKTPNEDVEEPEEEETYLDDPIDLEVQDGS